MAYIILSNLSIAFHYRFRKPRISFISKEAKRGQATYSEPIVLPDPLGSLGNEKAGFPINGKINRRDWDLNWNAALETKGVLVSNDVSHVRSTIIEIKRRSC